MKKFRAKKDKIELWVAARTTRDAMILISVLLRRGYDVERADDLPDPVWPENRTEDWIITPPGWDMSYLSFLYL